MSALDRIEQTMRALIDPQVARYWEHFASGCNDPLYLYYRPSSETAPGELRLCPGTAPGPVGFLVADPQAYRAGLTREQVYRRMRRLSLPVLPFGS